MMLVITSMPLSGPDPGKAPIRRPLPRRSPPRPRCPSRPASARTASGRYRPGGPSPPARHRADAPRAGRQCANAEGAARSWCLDVLQDGVILPGQPIGIARPHVVLQHVTAGRARSGSVARPPAASRASACVTSPDQLASAPVTASRACSAPAWAGVWRHAGAGRDSRRTRPSAVVLRKSSMSLVMSSGSSEMGTWLRP